MSRQTLPFANSMPFGDAYAITFDVGTAATSGLQRFRFVIADGADTTGKRPVKYPAAGADATTIFGIIGGYRVQAPSTGGLGSNYGLGTADKPYLAGEDVAVTIRGSELVEAAVTDTGDSGYIKFGDRIKTDEYGRAVKYVAPTTAAFAAPATPTGAEVLAVESTRAGVIGIALGSPDSAGLINFMFAGRP